MPMPRAFSAFLVLCLLILPVFIFVPKSQSDDLDDLNLEISKLTESLNQSVAATKPLESQLTTMQNQITGIKSRAKAIEQDLVKKEKSIDQGYENLAKQEKLLGRTIRNFYIKSYYNSPLALFLSATSASEITNLLMYQRAKTNQDKTIITNLALSLQDLETRREKLKGEQTRLVTLNATLDEQSKKLNSTILGAKAFQQEVTGKLAELSARQQSIINAKSGGFTYSGDNELADEYISSSKGFRESAPSGSFAIFSFGAYTHRNGMSQYGARARAESGQSVEDILKAYYPNATLKKDYSVTGSITVDGHGSMPFEDQYLQGIYEMPSSWHVNALKAQAIAARTFAIRHTSNGQSSICTTEACQVFKNEKKGGTWEQAVNETKGWVLVDGGGNPVSTQYASTHGGFSNTGGWDTTDGQGGSNFIDRTYEKLGGSPWLYKAWWREHYSNSGATCGRSNPWLNGTEMADIVNAYLVLTRGSSQEAERIAPVTTSCWGGTPYSHDELRDVASKYGGLGSANSVTVTQGNGSTNSVTINGISMNATEFKKAFNLRAPGYVRIPQTGFAFFNIEYK